MAGINEYKQHRNKPKIGRARVAKVRSEGLQPIEIISEGFAKVSAKVANLYHLSH